MNWVWLVLALPLVGALYNGLRGARASKRTVGAVACGSVGLAFLVGIYVLVSLLGHPAEERQFTQTLFDWISIGSFDVAFSFLVDPLSVLMILVVTGVGFLIHVYSIGYMGEDEAYSRYFAWLNLFTFSMLLLVLADNFLLMFMGWELVGLCSYLLIGFWFTRPSAAQAAKKAFVVNRVGDLGFMIGLFVLFATFGTFDYLTIFQQAPETLALGGGLVTAITLLWFVGAAGKSAQIPLYVWLPDAMEGPTPVSALIHAATMVTAGVYMVVRANVLYQLAPVTLGVIAAIGAVTALFAATIALVNNDIKRVLAYSTVSQLGYMFLATGVGAFAVGMYHLTSHAFMKALLFLGAGSVMHAMADRTDMREMGGLRQKIPWTAIVFLIGALGLSGIPPFVGFFSKDLILEETFATGHIVLWLVGVGTALLTAFYMLRAYFMTFEGEPRYNESDVHPHESPHVMLGPLGGLAALSTVGGALWISLAGFAPLEHFLEPAIATEVGATFSHAYPIGPALLAFISVVVALAGAGLAWMVYVRGWQPSEGLRRSLRPVYGLLAGKYYVDEFYHLAIVRPGQAIAAFLAGAFDRGFLDGIVNGVGRVVNWAGGALRPVESGYARSYASWMLLGAIVLLIYWMVA